ncbi:hypothetical protein [Changpingibacter yushuensis]|uniref:hypothetical protein n=1 Tax=Changpingibacter yushuensis TaxID=2758440 RepID=UPI00165E8E63|nr:hypothetical protein [Changpingibacter yushuensis]
MSDAELSEVDLSSLPEWERAFLALNGLFVAFREAGGEDGCQAIVRTISALIDLRLSTDGDTGMSRSILDEVLDGSTGGVDEFVGSASGPGSDERLGEDSGQTPKVSEDWFPRVVDIMFGNHVPNGTDGSDDLKREVTGLGEVRSLAVKRPQTLSDELVNIVDEFYRQIRYSPELCAHFFKGLSDGLDIIRGEERG